MYTVSRFQHSMISIAALVALFIILSFFAESIPKTFVEFTGYFAIGWTSAKFAQWIVDKFFEAE